MSRQGDPASETHADLLVFGDGVEQLDIQFGVVLGKWLMAVMVDKLHNGAEGQRVGEAILSLSMEDLYQLVVASFPEGVSKSALNQMVTFCPLGCDSSCSCPETLTIVQPFTGNFLYSGLVPFFRPHKYLQIFVCLYSKWGHFEWSSFIWIVLFIDAMRNLGRLEL